MSSVAQHRFGRRVPGGIGNDGHVRWTLKDGADTVLDVTKTNVDLFMADRVRPKCGIYRSVRDRANLRECYLLIRNLAGGMH